MLSDEEILKQVCKEMGITWNDTPGCMTINGQKGSEYLKKHNVFDDERYYQQILFDEAELNKMFAIEDTFDACDDFLIAA